MSDKKVREFYRKILLIRKFEELLFDLFDEGHLTGTIHTSNGQEAIAVGIIDNLSPEDIIISTHRCHGHFIAYTQNILGILAEIMGKADGVCKGRGGSQHLHLDNFYSSGVLGNLVPVGAGMVYAEIIKENNALGVIFIGDGAFGEGTVYETLNLISLWNIPVLIVIENNHYAQSTPISMNFSGSFKGRIQGFGISFTEITSNDVIEINKISKTIVNNIRSNKTPECLLINTYRLSPHSKGDDDRPKSEITAWMGKDPLIFIEEHLDDSELNKIRYEISLQIENTKKLVLEMPNPTELYLR